MLAGRLRSPPSVAGGEGKGKGEDKERREGWVLGVNRSHQIVKHTDRVLLQLAGSHRIMGTWIVHLRLAMAHLIVVHHEYCNYPWRTTLPMRHG